MINHVQQSFNGGQMAPLLHSRADIDKYRAGGRTVDNFIPSPFGPLRRRPGTVYAHEVKTSATKTRLINFDLSSGDGYILELGVGYLRFIKDRAQLTEAGTAWADATSYTQGEVTSNGGVYYLCLLDHVSDEGATPGVDDGAGDTEPGIGTDAATYWHTLITSGSAGIYEWPTEYADGELFDIQVAQINDVMYFVHPDHEVVTLSRLGDTEWIFAEETWTWPPLRDVNITTTTMTPSAVTGSITLTSSADFFTSDMVGGHMMIEHTRDADMWEVKKDLTAATGTTTSIAVRGDYQVRTTGVSAASISIEESEDDSSFTSVRDIVTSASENFIFTTTTDGGSGALRWIRINHTAGTSGSSEPRAIIEAVDGPIAGWVTITGYSSATSVTATVSSRLSSTDATTVWAEGAFSDRRGHARTVTLHELRMIFGSTDTDRQHIWGSQTDDFPNFETGTADTDGYRYQLASTDQNSINWLVSQKQLLVGTAGGEWVLDSGRDENTITPTNVRARRHSNFGSEYRQALAVDAATLFVRAGGERLADFSYLFEDDGYSSQDLNLLSYDLTRGGIVQSAYQKKRDPQLWAAVDGNSLAMVAYNRRQQVTGWSSINSLGGNGDDVIESVAVVGRAGDESEVWVVVKRTINSFVKRYVERLDSDSFDKQEDATCYSEQDGETADTGTNLVDMIYLDSSYTASGGDLTDNGDGTFTVGGFDHLVGEDIVAFVDGARVGDTYTVDGSGEITVTTGSMTKCLGGFTYTSTFRTLPFFNQLETGSTRGREVSLKKCMVRIYRSGGFNIQAYDDPNTAEEVGVRSTDTDEGDPTPLRTEDFELAIESRHRYDPSLIITADEPTPLTLEMLVMKMEVYGD